MKLSNEIKLEIIKNDSKLQNLLFKIQNIHFQEYKLLSEEARKQFNKYRKSSSEWMNFESED